MSPPELTALQAALAAVVHGQDDAATGLVLALVAREHAYLEGPPGCGKSALGRALGRACGARAAELAFHRDASAADLLGEVRLRRERLPARGGERIALELAAGPSAHAEVLLLDDLARAPGEALGLLLRVLAERRFGGRALPLECAVATAGPPDLESYADPLEPTQLDRFAVQLRLHGLVGARRFGVARALLDREPLADAPVVLDTEKRHALQARAAALSIAPAARAALLRAVEALARAAASEPALLSDRAFARAAPRILQANALLRGAPQVEPADVRALRFMLARRVPEALEPELPGILEEAIADTPSTVVGARPAAAVERTGQAPAPSSGAADAAVPVDSLEAHNAPLDAVAPLAAARGEDEGAAVEALVAALAGALERGAVERGDDPGGQPRAFRRMRRLDEIADADPVDAQLFVEGRQPHGARVYRRARRNAGGVLAVLRDVSASMEGRLARWAGEVVAGLVRVGARRRMRLGYVEFNHEAERFAAGGAFFHRRYRRVLALASRRRAEGRTNYEAPLRAALAEFKSTAGRDRHIVLLSDGVPVLGDPAVRSERALARRLGVKVHTVFLGLGECPAVLDEISRETEGLRFEARPRPDGRLVVKERERASPVPTRSKGDS